MSEQEYTVKVRGPGLAFDRSIDETTALSIVAAVMGGRAVRIDGKQKAAEGPETETEAENAASAEQVTIGEFLAPLNTPGNAERIAGILFFALEHLGQARVPVANLLEWFQRAGESPPKNLRRDVRKAVRKGLISEDTKHDDEYFVTKTGIQVLRGASKSISRSGSQSPASPPPHSGEANVKSPRTTNVVDSEKSELKPRRRQRSATASGSGPLDRVRALVSEGWFTEARTVKNLVDEMARKGAHYRGSDFTWAMQKLVQSGDLSRSKQQDASGRSVWHYTSPEAATSAE